MNFKLGANVATAVIYRMLVKHNRYKKKDRLTNGAYILTSFFSALKTLVKAPLESGHALAS